MTREYRLYQNNIEGRSDEWAERNNVYKKIGQRVKGNDTVLDLGCSSGYGARWFKYSHWVDAVDNCKEAIDFARANYERFRPLHFHWADAETFLNRVPNRYYKAVICCDMLHHNTGDERNIVEECVRVCGRVLFLQMQDTPRFSLNDAIATVRRLRPNMQHQELLSGECPLVMFFDI